MNKPTVGEVYEEPSGARRVVRQVYTDAHGRTCVKWARPGKISRHTLLEGWNKWASKATLVKAGEPNKLGMQV